MNLTKCFAVGLCLSAMGVSAEIKKANAFETLAEKQQTGWFVGVDKTLESSGIVVTNEATGRDTYSGGRPMATSDNGYVLKLDTEGGVWTNEVNQPFAGEGNPPEIYADMLVKFVPSEELPAPSGLSGKLAIAVKADANATNRLNITWDDSTGFASWTEISSKEISTTVWHRVTVKMYTVDEGVTPRATVYLDGEEVLDQQINGYSLNSIGFQGTGFVDEVVVRDDDPISTAVLLTLSFTTGDFTSVMVGAVAKTNGATVTSGDVLEITAAQWKEVANVSGTDVTTTLQDGTTLSNSFVKAKVEATAAGKTVNITAQTETSTAPTSGSGTTFDGAPMNKVATWALQYSVTSLTSDKFNNYLFNIDDNALVPTLLITSITVTGSTAEITVTAGSVDLQQINGTLKIKTYPTLGGAETVTNATVIGWSPVKIQHNMGSDKFIKAAVE